MKGVVVI